MRNVKTWLIIKGILIIILTLTIIFYPTQDNFRKIFRFIILAYFVISFIVDLNRLKKQQ
ncbi:MAG: hypothetical protein R2765_02465 [Ferruginibacter sp.]|nr:hypothetical protein [Bacteroidota bacterium]MBX2918221.1 hypothetical protein [Ferruginibacter sp.]MCB0708995.1 hypothetical protein [Chitinophagaceae bacterium]MCC7377901.1 hypothetical protein [Chitinophagaceae bacterium]